MRQLARNMTLEALTQISAEGRALPRLAERWAWENDGRRLRVALRKGIALHDGRRLDAQTAAEALADAIEQTGNRDSHPSLAEVRSAIPLSALELALDLAKPSPQLPVDLTVLLPIPAGPFRVVHEDQDTIELTRFDHYYQGTPSISRITLQAFDALRTSWASLLRGEIDMAYDVPVDVVDFVRNEDVDIVSVPRWYQYQLIFNQADPRFRSPLVRKALNLAVDRAAIIKRVLHASAESSSGPIYTRYWAFDSTVPNYSYDPVGAAALLDAAGYRLPKSSGTSAPPARFRFTCLIPKDFTVWERIALEVQRDLFNIGVDMQFKVVPLKEFGTLVFSGQLESAFVNMISGPTPSRSYMWWRSAARFKGAYNAFGYENVLAEALYEVLNAATNEAAIRGATSKFQRVFFDDPPALYLAWDTRTRAIHRRFKLPDHERDPMWALWKWTITPLRDSGER